MALSYRTPTEEVLNRFSSDDQNRISSSAAQNFQEKEKSYGKFFSYHLPPKAKEKLSGAGIYLSPFPFLTHSHPCCKILENHLLYNVLADKLDSSFFFVGIKSSKLEFLKTVDKSLSVVESINRMVTTADRYRYGNHINLYRSGSIYGLKSKNEIRLPPETRLILPHLVKSGGKNLFLHDEIHYWSKESLMDFLMVLRPSILIATLVFPPEVLIGSPESLNPWCYQYKIDGCKLHFFPDGVMSESYTQHIDSGFLLKTKRIILPNGCVYGVDLVHNKFAHSVITITEGNFVNQEKRFFSNFCAIDFSELYCLFDKKSYADCLPISPMLVSKIYRYLRTLKKPDQQSAMAKLSQLMDEPTSLEIKFVEDFSSLIIKHESERSMICPSALKAFSFFLGRLLPDKLSRLLTIVKSMSLDTFISKLKEFSFELELENLDAFTTTRQYNVFQSVSFENGKAYVTNFEDVCSGKEKKMYYSKPRGRYCYDIYDGMHVLLSVSEDDLIRMAFKHLIKSFTGTFDVLANYNHLFFLLINNHKVALISKARILEMKVELSIILFNTKKELRKRKGNFFFFSKARWFLKRGGARQNIKFLTHFGSPKIDLQSDLEFNYFKVLKELISHFPDPKQALKRDPDVEFWLKQSNEDKRLERPPPGFKVVEIQEPLLPTPSFNPFSQKANIQEEGGSPTFPQPHFPAANHNFFLLCGATKILINDLNCTSVDYELTDSLRGRKAAWYTKEPLVDYAYTGFKHKAKPWTESLSTFCEKNGIDSAFDSVLIQEYSEGGQIALHADDEPLFDHNSPILTVNLLGSCTFGFACRGCDPSREISGPCKFEMPSGLQLTHKHFVKNCSQGRTSLTFRKIIRDEVHNAIGAKINQGDSPVTFEENSRIQNLKGIYKVSKNIEDNFRESLEFGELHMNGAAAALNIEQSAKLKECENYHIALTRCECIYKELASRKNPFNLIKTDYSPGENLFGNCVALQNMSPFYFNTLELVNLKSDRVFELNRSRGALDRDGELTFFVCRGQAVLILESIFRVESEKCAFFYLKPGDIVNFPKSFFRINSLRVANSNGDLGSLFGFLEVIDETTSFGPKITHACKDGLAIEDLSGVRIDRRRNLAVDDFNIFQVPGDGNCFWSAVALCLGLDGKIIKASCKKEAEKKGLLNNATIKDQFEDNAYIEKEGICICVRFLSLNLYIICEDMGFTIEMNPIGSDARDTVFLLLKNQHYSPILPKNGCVVRAVASALNKPEFKILSLVCKMEDRAVYDTLVSGQGMQLAEVERVMRFFDIRAVIRTPDGTFTSNPDGKTPANFELKNDHLLHVEHSTDIIGVPKPGLLSNFSESEAVVKLKTFCDSITYTPELSRAKKLFESLQDGTTGVMSSKAENKLPKLMDSARNVNIGSRELHVMLGTFGSGKSSIYRNAFLECKTHDVYIVSPRKRLAFDLEILLGVKDKKGQFIKNNKGRKREVRILTFEKFLLQLTNPIKGSVVLDEIQLFPPGYVDLITMNVAKTSSIFLIGDPCQSDYDSASDRNIFSGLDSDVLNILKNETYHYNVLSRRFKSDMFSGRLPCLISNDEELLHDPEFTYLESISEAKEYDLSKFEVFLVSSFEEKKVILAHFGASVECLTFGESTGLTFNNGIVVVSYESIATSERRWVTALSRFRYDVMLLSTTGLSLDEIWLNFEGRFLAKYLSKKASVSDLLPLLPGNAKFTQGFGQRIGKDEGVKELKLSGDPWLKTELFLGQQEDQEIAELEEAFAQEEWFKTHIPITSLDVIRAKWVHRIMLKEFREVRCGTEVSNQFTDEHPNHQGEILTNAAERFETIYPRHRGNDSVTFLMAVKKRLKFSQPNVEAAKLRNAMPYGKFMLNEFLKKVPLKQNHNHTMMKEALQDFEDKKTSKSAAVIENHSGRSCRDWLADVALIFMKSQLCTKFDNRFRDAKAGQTLACFQHSVLVRFAPYMRYIEKKIFEVLPPRFYIHSGKNLDDLDAWVKVNNFSGVCTESDYEAFDSSQDHYILAFEIEVMKYLGLPSDLIEDYKMIKFTLRSKLGSFAIMRFTGEASTFLFNTMANMLFTFLKYEIKGSESICFAGDDMSANTHLGQKREHENFLKKLSLKAKVAFTDHPTFCGWNLTPKGIYKKPQLVLERLCIAREKNNLHNCLDSYAIEVSYAYSKGELIKEYMDEEEIESHYSCVRFIIRNKHLLKSDVVSKFVNIA
ncbi:replicase [Garlic yellow stripe associated virus]|nr:replicase [Garlic yellow stripe associated virus]